METKRANKVKSKKPIYILIAVLVFFILFISLISMPSKLNTAIDEIQISTNVNEVKSIFDKYKFDLLETDENGNKCIAVEFQDELRKKLSTFNLDEKEIKHCLEWLPTAKTNVNVIVVPDLSRRILDEINNPNQVANDKIILSSIWKSFVEISMLKQDSKDKLIIDVTDVEQAKGKFNAIANNLQFDLSNHKGKSNRLYFTADKTDQFNLGIEKMYNSAVQKPLGADYVFYFKRYLESRIKKNTLFDNYVNKIVIITDGYLEPEESAAYTKLAPQLYKSLNIGNTNELISILGLNIPNVNVDLSNSEILICEVNERKKGKGKDFEILKAYWTDWLQRMNARNIKLVHREQATDITVNTINQFIKQ
ncbi:hypothetical protein EH230_12040 [Flavobacterium columnare]|uniref:VWFA domain-containing protein n=1 Tax=Flavobacterium columnare TaxID=996 RepID=A0A437UD70_9FLAO|nr:hypothetical protein EH230_12040 [Flavobacterium columnare]